MVLTSEAVGAGSGVERVGLAEGDGQLQLLLLLQPQPPQPLLALAVPLGPLQLLPLTSKLQQRTGEQVRAG